MPDRRPIASLLAPSLVAVGGFAGAALRHGVGLAVTGPSGTLVANVVGCAVLGGLLHEATLGGRLPRSARLLLGTGLVSSFTTYSTFAVEAATAPPGTAAGYVLATYGLGLIGVLLGRRAAAAVSGVAR